MKNRNKPILGLTGKAKYNLFGVSYLLWKSGLEQSTTLLRSQSYRCLVYSSLADLDSFVVLVRSSANTFYYFDSDGVIKTFSTVTDTVTQTLKFFQGE